MNPDVANSETRFIQERDAACSEPRCLEFGARILLDEFDEVAGRIDLSSGTQAAPSMCQGFNYEQRARIPAPVWRPPTGLERDRLIVKARPYDSGTVIAIVRIPPELLRPLGMLRDAAAACSDRKEVLQLVNVPECIHGITRIKKYLRQHFTRDGEPEGGIVVKPPKLATVTTNPRSNLLVGMHLDDWYRFPLQRRHASPNRICVNIGCEDRFLLFLGLTIQQIHDALISAGVEISFADKGGTALGRTFMNLFSSYPVVRVRVRPGEAYIAPTENIVHDGSSAEMSTFDVSLSLRGTFEPVQKSCRPLVDPIVHPVSICGYSWKARDAAATSSRPDPPVTERTAPCRLSSSAISTSSGTRLRAASPH